MLRRAAGERPRWGAERRIPEAGVAMVRPGIGIPKSQIGILTVKIAIPKLRIASPTG